MHNCIFTPHCTEYFCDKSCPVFAEVSYLLERNKLLDNSQIYISSQKDIDSVSEKIDKCKGSIGTLVIPSGKSSLEYSDLITYCAICKNWKGSQLHVNVFNLKYSSYLESLKKSWTSGPDDDLEYLQIWIKSAKVLIISNLDFVDFKDFESQTLLSILQDRMSEKFTTLLVTPPINSLISTKSSVFFDALKRMLKNGTKVVSA